MAKLQWYEKHPKLGWVALVGTIIILLTVILIAANIMIDMYQRITDHNEHIEPTKIEKCENRCYDVTSYSYSELTINECEEMCDVLYGE